MKSVLSALEPILLGNSSPRPEQILRAKRRYQSGAGLIEASTESGVNARTLASALAQLYRLPMQPHIDCDAINRGLLANMPVRYARAHRLLPLSSNGRELVVAIADPSNYVALDDLGMLFQMPVRPIVTPCDVLDQAINRIAEEIAAPGIRSRIVDLDQAHLENAARRLSQEPAESVDHAAGSVKALVRGLIREAINEGASDLRLEPREAELRARYSVRGLSYDLMSAPKCFEAAIIACLKTMACMNPTESNASRQGYISIRLARRIAGVVVSIIPCAAGEAVTLGLDGHGLGL
ncbi:MAG TPA: ATPase, T2SS/T4P/T4SS family, partial [Candidatus Binataceae bacterium]|nr:ATPase, T2SS/T4P/T4SS family [Candidatus Binataceae bacterium]